MNKIYEIKNYTNKNNQNVSLCIDVNDENSIEYFGNTIVQFSDGKSPVNFVFPKDITSIEEAFSSFEKCVTDFIEQNYIKKEEQNKNNSENIPSPE